MKTLVLTMIGKDRPGLINQISQLVLAHQGNWIDSHFGRLAGQFAGIAEITLADEHEQPLRDALAALTGISITLEGGGPQPTYDDQIKLTVTANDRQGIVNEITDTLMAHQVNLLQVETTCTHAPNWGGALFQAQMIAALPNSITEAQLQALLEQLSDDLIVDMERYFPKDVPTR